MGGGWGHQLPHIRHGIIAGTPYRAVGTFTQGNKGTCNHNVTGCQEGDSLEKLIIIEQQHSNSPHLCVQKYVYIIIIKYLLNNHELILTPFFLLVELL